MHRDFKAGRHTHEGDHRERHGRRRWMRGEFGHRGGRGRSGARGRFFDQGDLRLVILSLLAEQPGHGYQLIKTLEERTGGTYAPSPGVVYPTLTLLEEQGLIEQSGADGARKLYGVTDAGREALQAEVATLKALTARLQDSGERGAGRSPRLLRAQANLKLALRMKLMTGPLTAEQADTIVAALDAAARAVDDA